MSTRPRNCPPTAHRRTGFSLIELVIVIVIIGIIAAIAIPRMSRGSQAAIESSLTANLAVLRNAVELFRTEHEGLLPTAATIAAQLTGRTSLAGTVDPDATPDSTHIYGPYIRAIPALPIPGTRRGATGIATADAAGVGWLYDTASTRLISANSTGASSPADSRGVDWDDY